jgi:hypothetical protein
MMSSAAAEEGIRMGAVVRRTVVAGVLVAALTATGFGAAPPATAVPGMSFVSATSPLNSDLSRDQEAHCPRGTRVLGGGGYVGGGAGQVMIDSMKPVTTATGDFFAVIATELAHPEGVSFTGDWSLVAYAICGPAPAGLQYVSARSGSAFSPSRSVTVSCPAGKRVIGAGGAARPEFGFVPLDEVAPSADLTSVRVTAFQGETRLPFAIWVDAFAVCADPLPGLTLVHADSPLDSSDKLVGVVCPAGTRVHSVGHDLVGAIGQAHVTALFPGQPLTSVRLTAAEDRDGLSRTWRARAYAICAA